MAEKKSKNIKYALGDILFYVITTVAAIVLFTFVLQIATVSGNSMNDTYQDGDKLVCLRLGSPKKGDVVICDSAFGSAIVKRVIAESGDTIDIDFETGNIILNGELLTEDYIKEPTQLDEGGFEYPVTIPEGCYFVMGDNRNDSIDSRDARIGFIKSEQIESKVLFLLPSRPVKINNKFRI